MKLRPRKRSHLVLIATAAGLACFAAAQFVFPQQVTVFRGKYVSGNLSSFFNSDDDRFVVTGGPTMNAYEAPLDLRLETVCGTNSPQRLVMTYETRANTPNLVQYVDMWEWTSSQWVTVDLRAVTTSDKSVTLDIPLCWRFADPTSGAMKMRFWVGSVGPTVIPNWQVSIDKMVWDVDPQ